MQRNSGKVLFISWETIWLAPKYMICIHLKPNPTEHFFKIPNWEPCWFHTGYLNTYLSSRRNITYATASNKKKTRQNKRFPADKQLLKHTNKMAEITIATHTTHVPIAHINRSITSLINYWYKYFWIVIQNYIQPWEKFPRSAHPAPRKASSTFTPCVFFEHKHAQDPLA